MSETQIIQEAPAPTLPTLPDSADVIDDKQVRADADADAETRPHEDESHSPATGPAISEAEPSSPIDDVLSPTTRVPMPATVEDCLEDDSHSDTHTSHTASSSDAIATPTETTYAEASGSENHVVTPSVSLSPSTVEASRSPASALVPPNTPGSNIDSDHTQEDQAPSVDATPHRGVPSLPPMAMDYLDKDSPPVTKEAIRRSAADAARRHEAGGHHSSPSGHSVASLASGTYQSDLFTHASSFGGPQRTWSPHDPTRNGQPAFIKVGGPGPGGQMPPDLQRSWTVPDHRGPPPALSHLGHSPTQSHFRPFPPQPAFSHIENVPLSGYQLLATKLTGQLGGMHVRPIYRRFETLNHRLLLYLQDEIVELEEQLHGLDTSDTQARMFSNGILPASRRQEMLHNSDAYWRKADILGKIGYKLWQYNKLLVSFRDTTDLPCPTMNDVHDYRAFVGNGNHVVEDETKFLAMTADLVTVDATLLRGQSEYSEDVMTPMPRSATDPEFPILIKSGDGERPSTATQNKDNAAQVRSPLPPAAITHLALAIFGAVLVPVFTFAVIFEFEGRITVVLLVASGVMSTLVQSGLVGLLVEERGVLPLVVCASLYVVVMAMAAATFR